MGESSEMKCKKYPSFHDLKVKIYVFEFHIEVEFIFMTQIRSKNWKNQVDCTSEYY